MNFKKLIKDSIKHPFRLLNVFGMKLFIKFQPIKMPFYPSFVAIEPTINCNLNCIMCQIKTLKRDKRELEFNAGFSLSRTQRGSEQFLQ